MTATDIERGVADVVGTAERSTTADELLEQVSDRLRRVVPFDGSTWFGADPQTLLATNPVLVENIEAGHCETYWEREHTVEDVLLFRDLARTATGVGTLHEATDGSPARSARHREFLAPQGYDDELRIAFRAGQGTWGLAAMCRDRGRPSFSATEVETVRRVGAAVAGALRRLAVVGQPAGELDQPGTALYDESGGLLSLDAQAQHWLDELQAGVGALEDHPHRNLTPVIAVVARAPMVARGRASGPSTARVRTPAGQWLFVQASCLRSTTGGSGPIALTIGPAKSSQLAPIIVEAYGLTAREQDITQSVARGLSNQEIAKTLHLSPYTVRDHLKAVFAKLGVGSRGELISMLFAEHYAPTMHEGAVHRAV